MPLFHCLLMGEIKPDNSTFAISFQESLLQNRFLCLKYYCLWELGHFEIFRRLLEISTNSNEWMHWFFFSSEFLPPSQVSETKHHPEWLLSFSKVTRWRFSLGIRKGPSEFWTLSNANGFIWLGGVKHWLLNLHNSHSYPSWCMYNTSFRVVKWG